MASCGGSSKHTADAGSAPDSIPSQGSLPTGVVAAVRSAPITVASFQHWFEVAYNERGLLPTHQVLPAPPAFASCVATAHAQSGPVSKEAASVLRSRCAHSYAVARSDAIGFLVRAQWLQQEGSTQGVSISGATLNKARAQAIQKGFPGAGAFQKFLAKAGMTRADFDFKVRLNAIADALLAKASPSVTASAAQVAQYYRAHRAEYAIPPRRKTLIVETQTRAEALRARAALLSGQSWATVANRYSIDFSKLVGGVFAVTPGEQDPKLVRAAFSAPRGSIEGPVSVPKTAGAGSGLVYYVFKVIGGTPASHQPLPEASQQIRQRLDQSLQQQSLASFEHAYYKRWRARTRCRAGYVVSYCSNGTPSSNGI